MGDNGSPTRGSAHTTPAALSPRGRPYASPDHGGGHEDPPAVQNPPWSPLLATTTTCFKTNMPAWGMRTNRCSRGPESLKQRRRLSAVGQTVDIAEDMRVHGIIPCLPETGQPRISPSAPHLPTSSPLPNPASVLLLAPKSPSPHAVGSSSQTRVSAPPATHPPSPARASTSGSSQKRPRQSHTGVPASPATQPPTPAPQAVSPSHAPAPPSGPNQERPRKVSLSPSRHHPRFNAKGQRQCQNCKETTPGPSWRKWKKDATFQICHRCHSRYTQRQKSKAAARLEQEAQDRKLDFADTPPPPSTLYPHGDMDRVEEPDDQQDQDDQQKHDDQEPDDQQEQDEEDEAGSSSNAARTCNGEEQLRSLRVPAGDNEWPSRREDGVSESEKRELYQYMEEEFGDEDGY
ncbi:hypothetical protein CF336_g8621 [Tilletia laevis]|nr:hypothetical protein CF336_g8621 [Tilletia laevis]